MIEWFCRSYSRHHCLSLAPVAAASGEMAADIYGQSINLGQIALGSNRYEENLDVYNNNRSIRLV
jgi:hypothetical protein